MTDAGGTHGGDREPGAAVAVEARGLERSFGSVRALRGVDLTVPAGSVLGLLGPNGAGKTTTVRILATLLRPTAGEARVNGFDVVREAEAVRASIGLTGQYAALDEHLTGRENLELIGRLYHQHGELARRRAGESIERFGLAPVADRPVGTYSGGTRRRVDLAASLINRPPVVFLDEPTTGLDPRSRADLWQVIEELVGEGTTLLLTTQYLEEADRLADRIAVIDSGTVIARGTPDELKSQVGGATLDLVVADRDRLDEAREVLAFCCPDGVSIERQTGRITGRIEGGGDALPEVVRRLDAHRIAVASLELRRPSLDEVFLALTGRPAAEPDPGESGGDGGVAAAAGGEASTREQS